MNIVLNEKEWLLEKLSDKSLGDKPSETLSRLTKYYSAEGLNRAETRRKLEEFILSCDSAASLPKWSKSLDRTVKRNWGEPLVSIDFIPISTSELDKIQKLKGEQIRRLAFTLLCLGKYQKRVNGLNDYWVCAKESEIVRLANINTSLKRRCLMFKRLNELNLIEFSKRADNTNVRICFADKEPPALKITNFKNLGYQYMMYCGKPYFACVRCGTVTKYSNPNVGRKQLYCKECAIKIAAQKRNKAAAKKVLEKTK